jgi:PAS domain S-box-containing protein
MESPRRVVVVTPNGDDDEWRARLLRAGSVAAGIARSPAHAIAMTREMRPDVVIVDSPADGDDVVTEEGLRSLGIPVIHCIAASAVPGLQRIMAAAPCNFLVKPVREGDLSVAIASVCRRQQFEAERANLERAYVVALENIGEGIVAVDSEGRVQYLNRAAEALTGWSRKDASGQPAARLLPPVRDGATGAAGRGAEASASDPADSARRPAIIVIRRQDERMLTTRIDVPSFAAADAFAPTARAMRNVARGRRAEDRFRGLMESAPDAMLIADAAGRIMVVNSQTERMFGYPRSELVGRTVDQLIPQRFHRQHHENYARYAQTPRTRPMGPGQALYGVRKDGTEFRVEISLSPVRGIDEMFVYCAIRDVTERLALESRLRQTQKMESIGQLSGGIAHDFNNVLSVILGYTELAQMKSAAATSAELASYLAEIERAVERAKGVISQLLTFSRPAEPAVDVIRIAPAILQVTELCRATFPATFSIELDLPDHLPGVRIAPAQLHQVLMNLSINARDAMDGKGSVALRVAPVSMSGGECASCHHAFEGDYVLLSMRDEGCGIEPAQMQRLFEPFYTTKPLGKGTGLGLSVLHGVVHSAGGHVEVISNPGQGAEFRIYLPAFPEPADEPRDGVKPARALPRASGNVMVVDDEPAVVSFMCLQLESIGCESEGYSEPALAMAAFAANPSRFDLIITDQSMPNMTGVELARAVLKLRPDVPIILCSGGAEAVDEMTAMDAGIRRLLFKPVSVNDLAVTVAALREPG